MSTRANSNYNDVSLYSDVYWMRVTCIRILFEDELKT